MAVRLHKYLAHCGIASRRKAEEMMQEGRVMVNGKPATEPGTQIDPETDDVAVDGVEVEKERKVYVVLHKPKGYVTTADDDLGRKTVLDLVEGFEERLYPVGRLDRESEGLLVLTNDGDLAYYLTHPSCEVRKTYKVTVDGFVQDEIVEQIRSGVRVGGRKVVPRYVKIVNRNSNTSRIEMEIGEGLNREVRRIFASVGHEARKLIRTRIGPLELEGLPRGRARLLSPGEIRTLKKGMVEQGVIDKAETPARKERGPSQGKGGGRGKFGKGKGRGGQGSKKRGGKPDPRGFPKGRKKSGAKSDTRSDSRKPRGKGQGGTKSSGPKGNTGRGKPGGGRKRSSR